MTESAVAQILGKIPSGLFILTIRNGDQETGLLASWVMQAGFEPPMISVAVRQGRLVAEWLAAESPFVLNVLPEGSKDLLKHFARGFEPGQPAFEGLEIARTSTGTPILTDTAGHLECRPTAHVDSGDHRIFLAQVTGGSIVTDQKPLVHIRNNGLRY